MGEFVTPRWLVVVALVIILLTYLVLFVYAYTTESEWEFVTLANDGGDGLYSEIKIVNGNEIHVLQRGYENGPYSLMYSNWTEGRPDPTPIYAFNEPVYSFQWASMAVNGEGRVHIFMGVRNDGPMYANETREDWGFISLPLDDFSHTGLAVVDDVGQFHVLYAQDPYSDLQGGNDVIYATNPEGDWALETVFDSPANTTAMMCGLGSDNQGRLHCLVGVYDWQNGVGNLGKPGRLVCASLDAPGWSATDVLQNYTIVGLPSMVVGSDGTAHVSLYVADGDTYSLAYASNSDGSWDLQIIGDAGNFSPWNSAIALGQGNEIHIGYFRYYWYPSSNQDADYSFWYARMVEGVWSTERVSSTFSVGNADTSIAIDRDGRAHMTFPKLDADGFSHCVCTAKKTSQVILAESLTDALRTTTLLMIPAAVIAIAAYALVQRRREKKILREGEQEQTGLHD